MSDDRPLEMENSGGEFKPPRDVRPKLPEPLPVKLVAVDDVYLPTLTGLERQMDEFYVKVLGFQKAEDGEGLVYHAENFRLVFENHERLIERESYRPLQVEILSLVETERLFIDREVEYTRQKGLHPGTESLLLRDPAGNWVELVESRPLA